MSLFWKYRFTSEYLLIILAKVSDVILKPCLHYHYKPVKGWVLLETGYPISHFISEADFFRTAV